MIDDDRILSELVALALSQKGYKVLTAPNGRAGFDLAQQEKPDLILLDIHMPVMDGWDTLRLLRLSVKTKTSPILMLTTQGLIRDVDKAMELGATSYLVKPFDMGRLMKKIASTLGLA